MVHVLRDSSFEMYGFESQTQLTEYCDADLFDGRDQCWEWMGLNQMEWQDLVAKTKSAWEHGIEVIDSFKERLMKLSIPELKSRKRKGNFKYEGDEVDPERLVQGDEKYFKDVEREQSMGATELTIFIDTTTPNTVDSDDIFWRGAAALALAQILEDKGYKVEIWVVSGTMLYAYKQDCPVFTACCLKRCQDPFDVSTLVNVVSGWFFRSVNLNLFEKICKENGQQAAMGLGSATSPKSKHLDLLSLDLNRIYVSKVFTFSGACRIVEEEIKKLAAPV